MYVRLFHNSNPLSLQYSVLFQWNETFSSRNQRNLRISNYPFFSFSLPPPHITDNTREHRLPISRGHFNGESQDLRSLFRRFSQLILPKICVRVLLMYECKPFMYRIRKYRLDLSLFKFVRLANSDTVSFPATSMIAFRPLCASTSGSHLHREKPLIWG